MRKAQLPSTAILRPLGKGGRSRTSAAAVVRPFVRCVSNCVATSSSEILCQCTFAKSLVDLTVFFLRHGNKMMLVGGGGLPPPLVPEVGLLG